MLNLVAGSMLGILLAVAAALLLESRDQSIRTVEDVKKHLPLSCAGNYSHLWQNSAAHPA